MEKKIFIWLQIEPEENNRINRDLLESFGLENSGGNAKGYSDYEGYITDEQIEIIKKINIIKLHIHSEFKKGEKEDERLAR
jgi:hypothetical protein